MYKIKSSLILCVRSDEGGVVFAAGERYAVDVHVAPLHALRS